jgi:hypothetical protein
MTITVSTLAECPFSIADEYAKEYLQRAEGGGAESLVRVPWFVPFPKPAHRVQLTFGLHSDITDHGRRHDEIRLRWTSGTPLLPNFHGVVSFRIESMRTRIFIEGNYDAPLGLAGRCFDEVIGKRIARASLQDLGERLRVFLERREQSWRETRPIFG